MYAHICSQVHAWACEGEDQCLMSWLIFLHLSFWDKASPLGQELTDLPSWLMSPQLSPVSVSPALRLQKQTTTLNSLCRCKLWSSHLQGKPSCILTGPSPEPPASQPSSAINSSFSYCFLMSTCAARMQLFLNQWAPGTLKESCRHSFPVETHHTPLHL